MRVRPLSLFLPVLLAGTVGFSSELVNNARVLGVSLERPVIDTAAVARVNGRLGDVSVRSWPEPAYRLRNGIEADFTYRFVVHPIAVDAGDRAKVIRNGRFEIWEFQAPGELYFHGAAVGGLFAPGSAREVASFLTSAYLLETGGIRFDSAQYLRNPPVKEDGTFWKRNLISQGWGAQYIYSENPYGKNGWLPIGFGYLLDAATLAGAVGVAITGDRPQDRIGAPLAMLGTSLFFKVLLNGWVAKGHMNTYNRFVRSGYPIPRTHWYDFERARFGHYPRDSVRVRKVTPGVPPADDI